MADGRLAHYVRCPGCGGRGTHRELGILSHFNDRIKWYQYPWKFLACPVCGGRRVILDGGIRVCDSGGISESGGGG